MKSMDHLEAVRIGAAERYLLGELSPDLREQYEEHFFGCLECAQDVRAGAMFVDGARDILLSEKGYAPARVAPKEPSRSWWAAFLRPAILAPVMALLLLFAAYQNIVVIPGMSKALSESSTPQTIQSFSLASANSRAGGPFSINIPQRKPFTLFVDIPVDNRFAFYTCDLETESGTLIVSSRVSSDEAKEAVQMLIPSTHLAAGKYAMVVRGHQLAGEAISEVTRYPFTLDFIK
jgi:hypothetical protein